MSGHVLAVGSTLSDPTLVRASEEVSSLLLRLGIDEKRGTALLTVADGARTELLDGAFDVVTATGPGGIEEAARRVDILLDHVAMLSSSDLSFLLDPAYEYLIDARDSLLVEAIRRVEAALASADDHESDLRSRIRALLQTLGG
jgi:hypothetical protein